MVDINDAEKRVFIHHSFISAGDLDGSIADGDKLICDISRDRKGLHVSCIHAQEIDTTDVEIHDCTIVRVFVERGHGFVGLSALDINAFFHFSLLEDDQKSLLVYGYEFKAEIMPDHSRKQGGY